MSPDIANHTLVLIRGTMIRFACLAIPATVVVVAWFVAVRTDRDTPILPLPAGRDTQVLLHTNGTSVILTVLWLDPTAVPAPLSLHCHERLGFRCTWGSESVYGGLTTAFFHGTRRLFELGLPNVLAVPLLGVLPFAYLRRAKRAGHCAACGYDLRGTPNRCPECGLVSGSALNTAG